MSADNGIYILKTKGPEYRVIHAQAIENIMYRTEQDGECAHPWNPYQVWVYFNEAVCLMNEDKAWQVARDMRDEILSDPYCPILEYGICLLDYAKKEFPALDKERFEAYEKEEQKVQAKERVELEAAREKELVSRTFTLPAGIEIANGVIHGARVTINGEEVCGSINITNPVTLSCSLELIKYSS